jgi:hypothetical protein
MLRVAQHPARLPDDRYSSPGSSECITSFRRTQVRTANIARIASVVSRIL